MKLWKLLPGFVFALIVAFSVSVYANHPDHVLDSTTALVSWAPPGDSDLAGYVVFTGTASGVYGAGLDVGNVTSILFENLGEGTHYFAVLAYDLSGNQGDLSNEGSKTMTFVDSTPPGPPVLTVEQEIAAAQGHLNRAWAMLQVE